MIEESNTYSFSLVLAPFTQPLHEVEDALFEAGCDDALLCSQGTTWMLEFDREGASLIDAISSAMRDAIAGGVRPERIGPDDLVPAAEISRRAGVTRESVRLWSVGERGVGFPRSRTLVGKSRVWSWQEVALWLVNSNRIAPSVHEAAVVIADFNLALEVGRHSKSNPEIWGVAEKLVDSLQLQ